MDSNLTYFKIFGKQKAPKEVLHPLEASHRHLLVNPLSHFRPQKVKGFVVG